MRSLFLIAFLLALGGAVAGAHDQVNVCPGSNLAVSVNPCPWDIGDTQRPRTVLGYQGYEVDVLMSPGKSMDPTPTYEEIEGAWADGGGWTFFESHGGTGGCSWILVDGTPEGETFIFNLYWDLVDAGYDGEIYVGYIGDDPDDPELYTIGTYYSALLTYQSCDGVVDNSSCYGALVTYNALHTIGPIDSVSNSDARAYANETYNNLNGSDESEYSARIYKRALIHAIEDNPAAYYRLDGGPGNIVFTPAVRCVMDVTENDVNGTYPEVTNQGLALNFHFDAVVNDMMDVEDIVKISPHSMFEIDWDYTFWDTDTTLVVWVDKNWGEDGTGEVTIDGDLQPWSCAQLNLNGDAKNWSGDDFDLKIKRGDGPGARIASITFDGSSLSWVPDSERNVGEYVVYGWNGDWVELDSVSPGQLAYSYPVSGYDKVMLVEIETNGNIIEHGVASLYNTVPPHFHPKRTLEELAFIGDSLLERGAPAFVDSSGPLRSMPAIAPIITSSLFIEPLEMYAQAWEQWFGVERPIIQVCVGPNEATVDAIRDSVHHYMSLGAELFLFVGDRSDFRYFAEGGEFTAEYWPPWWQGDLTDYYSRYGNTGNPERNFLPGLYGKDPASPGQNVAGVQPFYPISDNLVYCDPDGDSIPNGLVGRLPFTEVEQVWNYCLKALYYMDLAGIGYEGPYEVNSFVTDTKYDDGDSEYHDGMKAAAVADTIEMSYPGDIYVHRLNATTYGGDQEQMLVAACERWDQGTEVVTLVASWSNRVRPGGHWVGKQAGGGGWTIDYLPWGSHNPFVIATSCGTSDYARTWNPATGSSVMLDMLAGDNRGCIGWWGVMCDTKQKGNQPIGIASAAYLWEDPSRPMGFSMLYSQQYILSNYDPIVDWDVYVQARALQYSGDPILPLHHVPHACSVDDQNLPEIRLALDQNYPNPTNDLTTIRFATSKRGEVSLRLFDANGRVVRTLCNGVVDAGVHNVVLGRDSRLAAGKYFYQLRAEGKKLNRTITIMR